MHHYFHYWSHPQRQSQNCECNFGINPFNKYFAGPVLAPIYKPRQQSHCISQTDMGNMLRRLYGDVAAQTYAKLIQEHLLIAADLVKAAVAGDQQGVMNA